VETVFLVEHKDLHTDLDGEFCLAYSCTFLKTPMSLGLYLPYQLWQYNTGMPLEAHAKVQAVARLLKNFCFQ